MKFVNGINSNNADETCPRGEKVVWAVEDGMPKIVIMTKLDKGGLKLYTESGSIMTIPLKHSTGNAAQLVKKSAEIVENLRIHLAVPTQSITMNRAEVEAMAKDLLSALAEATGESEATNGK